MGGPSHYCLTFFQKSADPSHCEFRNHQFQRDTDVEDWLDLSQYSVDSTRQWTHRMMIVDTSETQQLDFKSKNNNESRMLEVSTVAEKLYLPVSNDFYNDLTDLVGVPNDFSTMKRYGGSEVWCGFDYEGGKGVLLRTDLWDSARTATTLCSVIHEQKRLTCSVLYFFHGGTINSFVQRLHQLYTNNYILEPKIVPLLVLEGKYTGRFAQVEKAKTDVYRLETELGFHGSNHRTWTQKDLQDQISPEKEYSRFLFDLEAVNKDLLHCGYRFKASLLALEWITNCPELANPSTRVLSPRPGLIQAKLSFMRSEIMNADLRSGQLASRAHRALETCTALLALVDSRASNGIAKNMEGLTENIAGLTKRTEENTKIMRDISERAEEEGKKAALMAVVTFVFLPATAIATFFSMSFFDFSPGSTGRASSWVWLYAVVALVCTAFCLCCLWLVSRKHPAQGTVKA